MRAVLLAIASMGLVGCVGQLDEPGTGVGSGTNPNPNPPPPGGSQAKMMFESDVYPIIHGGAGGATADCSTCHNAAGPAGNVTGFVAPQIADAYATITSYQAVVGNFTSPTAGMLTKIAAGHNGRMYTPDQQQKINDWLAQEVTERGPTSPPPSNETPGQASARVLNEWSACMSLTNFKTANMTTAWGQMQANNGSRCESCHATGAQGMIVTEIESSGAGGPGLWTVLSTSEIYAVQYFTVDLTGGAANAKVVINHYSFDGVSKGQAPHAEHPQFNSTTNPGMTALKSFYDLTMAAVTAGGCGTTKFSPAAM